MQHQPTRVVREKVKPGIWRRKSANGRWVYEITFRDSDGRQRRQVVSGGMREAQTALAAVKARMGAGERVAPNRKLTFALAAEQWIEAKAPALTEKTVTTYRYGLDTHLLPAFGRKRLQEIDVTAVSKLIARMGTAEYRQMIQERNRQKVDATTGYSVQTVKSVLIPLSRTFAYAKRHLGFGGENPVSALDLDERPGYKQHRQKKRKLGRDELDMLIEAAESPWREIIATAAALGTRMGETLGLTWKSIDFETGIVSIEQQANAKRQIARVKTQTGVRKIEAPDWLISMFRELKIRSPYCGPEDLIFCTRTGKPHGHGNVLSRGLYLALDRAGLPRTSFHSLRHSHASLWIKDGGDVITLSKRLGHATPQVTMTTYADEIEEANDNAVRKARVNALFGATKMAARMAAAGGDSASEAASAEEAEVIALPHVGDSSRRVANAS
jgi:integrase